MEGAQSGLEEALKPAGLEEPPSGLETTRLLDVIFFPYFDQRFQDPAIDNRRRQELNAVYTRVRTQAGYMKPGDRPRKIGSVAPYAATTGDSFPQQVPEVRSMAEAMANAGRHAAGPRAYPLWALTDSTVVGGTMVRASWQEMPLFLVPGEGSTVQLVALQQHLETFFNDAMMHRGLKAAALPNLREGNYRQLGDDGPRIAVLATYTQPATPQPAPSARVSVPARQTPAPSQPASVRPAIPPELVRFLGSTRAPLFDIKYGAGDFDFVSLSRLQVIEAFGNGVHLDADGQQLVFRPAIVEFVRQYHALTSQGVLPDPIMVYATEYGKPAERISPSALLGRIITQGVPAAFQNDGARWVARMLQPAAGLEEGFKFGDRKVWVGFEERRRTEGKINEAVAFLRSRNRKYRTTYPALFGDGQTQTARAALQELWRGIQEDMGEGEGQPHRSVRNVNAADPELQEERFGDVVVWPNAIRELSWDALPYNVAQALLEQEIAWNTGFFDAPENPLTDFYRTSRDVQQNGALLMGANAKPTLPIFVRYVLLDGEVSFEDLESLDLARKQAVLKRALKLTTKGNAIDPNVLDRLQVSSEDLVEHFHDKFTLLPGMDDSDAAAADLIAYAIHELSMMPDNVGVETIGSVILTAVFLKMFPERKVTWWVKEVPYLKSDLVIRDLTGWKTEVVGIDGRSWFERFRSATYNPAEDAQVQALLDYVNQARVDPARFEIASHPWLESGLLGRDIPEDLANRIGGPERMLLVVGEWLQERFANGIIFKRGTPYQEAWGYLADLGIQRFLLLRMIKDDLIVVIPPGVAAAEPSFRIEPGGVQGQISYLKLFAGLEEQPAGELLGTGKVATGDTLFWLRSDLGDQRYEVLGVEYPGAENETVRMQPVDSFGGRVGDPFTMKRSRFDPQARIILGVQGGLEEGSFSKRDIRLRYRIHKMPSDLFLEAFRSFYKVTENAIHVSLTNQRDSTAVTNPALQMDMLALGLQAKDRLTITAEGPFSDAVLAAAVAAVERLLKQVGQAERAIMMAAADRLQNAQQVQEVEQRTLNHSFATALDGIKRSMTAERSAAGLEGFDLQPWEQAILAPRGRDITRMAAEVAYVVSVLEQLMVVNETKAGKDPVIVRQAIQGLDAQRANYLRQLSWKDAAKVAHTAKRPAISPQPELERKKEQMDRLCLAFAREWAASRSSSWEPADLAGAAILWAILGDKDQARWTLQKLQDATFRSKIEDMVNTIAPDLLARPTATPPGTSTAAAEIPGLPMPASVEEIGAILRPRETWRLSATAQQAYRLVELAADETSRARAEAELNRVMPQLTWRDVAMLLGFFRNQAHWQSAIAFARRWADANMAHPADASRESAVAFAGAAVLWEVLGKFNEKIQPGEPLTQGKADAALGRIPPTQELVRAGAEALISKIRQAQSAAGLEEGGGTVTEEQRREISQWIQTRLLEAARKVAANPDADEELRTKAATFEQVYGKLQELGERLVIRYYELAREKGLNPGKIRLYAVGGRVKQDPLRVGSDLDLVFAVEDPLQALGNNNANLFGNYQQLLQSFGKFAYEEIRKLELPAELNPLYMGLDPSTPVADESRTVLLDILGRNAGLSSDRDDVFSEEKQRLLLAAYDLSPAAGLEEEVSEEIIRVAAKTTEWMGRSALGLDTKIASSDITIREGVRQIAKRYLEAGNLALTFMGPDQVASLQVGDIFVEDQVIPGYGKVSTYSPVGDLIGGRWLPIVYIGIVEDTNGGSFYGFTSVVGSSRADQAEKGYAGGPAVSVAKGNFEEKRIYRLSDPSLLPKEPLARLHQLARRMAEGLRSYDAAKNRAALLQEEISRLLNDVADIRVNNREAVNRLANESGRVGDVFLRVLPGREFDELLPELVIGVAPVERGGADLMIFMDNTGHVSGASNRVGPALRWRGTHSAGLEEGERAPIRPSTRLVAGETHLFNDKHGVGVYLNGSVRVKDPLIVVEFYNAQGRPYKQEFRKAAIFQGVHSVVLASAKDAQALQNRRSEAAQSDANRASGQWAQKRRAHKDAALILKDAQPNVDFIVAGHRESLQGDHGVALQRREIARVRAGRNARQKGKYSWKWLSHTERLVARRLLPILGGLPIDAGERIVQARISQGNQQSEVEALVARQLDEGGRISKKTEELVVQNLLEDNPPESVTRWIEQYGLEKVERWLREAIPVVERVLSQELPNAGIHPRLTAGLEEEVTLYEGFTEQATGEIAAGLVEMVAAGLLVEGRRRAVVSMPSADTPGPGQLFIGDGLSLVDFAGLEEHTISADPAVAAVQLQEMNAAPADLIVLPDSVAVGLEESYRPAGNKTPILVLPAAGLAHLTVPELGALAKIARNLGGVYRAGLEELAERVISHEGLMSISY